MLGKTKNFLFNLCKRKTILFVFFFSFFGLTFARSASAGWVKDLLVGYATLPIFSIVWLAVKFSVWWTGFSGSFLNWVLSPNFISLSYTNPGGPNANPIIETGLGVTQGFVNMLLVLILVYIAIATILRLAGHETKKLLITFIIVALLVNFAPVICGLIVDASNIVMNFFIQDLKADAFGKAMGSKVDQISFEFDESLTMTNYKYILQLAIMVPFLLILGNILFLFAIIFILRYLVIWLLVILSPLAFACYILPTTRKYFDKWWEQFFNWSIIGITCGFFLYLALLLVVNIPTAINPPNTEEGTLFNAILPYFVSVIFLGLGMVFGLQTSAMGASTVVSFVKARGRGTLRGTAKAAGWVTRKAGSRIKEHAEDKLKIKERVHGLTQRWEKHPSVRWLLPEKVRKYGQMRPAIDELKKKLEYLSSRDLGRMMANKTLFGKEANAALMIMLDRGDTNDLVGAYKNRFAKETGRKPSDISAKEIFENETFRKEVTRPVQISFEAGYQSKLMRGDPRLAKLVAGKEWAFGYHKDEAGKIMTENDAVQKATGEARAKSIDNWEREVLEDEIVAETILSKGRDVPEAITRLVKRGQETLLKTFDKNFTSWVDNTLDPGIAKGVRKGDKKSTESAINKYQEFIKEKHGASGYFDYMKGQRAQEMGWREMKYDPSSKKRTPSPPTAGAAAMGSPPSPKGRRSGGRTTPTGKSPGGTTTPSGRRPGGRKHVESKVVKSKPLKRELPPSPEETKK